VIRVGKLGIVRLTEEDLEQLRRQCYERDQGKCVVCGVKLRWEPGYWDSMHMAHVRTKRNNGDTLDNVQAKCPGHHWQEHNPKAVPRKARR
jgi:5-methylcytosine-specific restriction endonuclease McrA